MTRSIVLAVLLGAALAACARQPVPPPPAVAASPVTSLAPSFVPYCGAIWSVDKQGYLIIPCPPDSNYPGAP